MNKARKLLLLVLSTLTLVFSAIGLTSCQILLGMGLGAGLGEMLECKHEYITETIAPKCGELGYDLNTCKTCGRTEKVNYTAALEHSYTTKTVAPTCTAEGYDEKTCSRCGDTEKVNYQPVADHAWETAYAYDNSFHWIGCKNCDTKKSSAEHSHDSEGGCTICDVPILPSEGVVYDLSADKTYYEVIGYEGTATKIRIADTYNNLPVKAIYEKAFYNNDTIKSVVIGNNVIVFAYINL